MIMEPVQNFYNEGGAVCFGCGRNNAEGLHVQTFWDGEQGLCTFQPAAYHTGFPGFVYGGLLASLIDCHCMGTAVAALYESHGRQLGEGDEIAAATGSLNIRYMQPTPIGQELTIRARPIEVKGRKVTLDCSVWAGDLQTVQAEVIAIQVPSDWRASLKG